MNSFPESTVSFVQYSSNPEYPEYPEYPEHFNSPPRPIRRNSAISSFSGERLPLYWPIGYIEPELPADLSTRERERRLRERRTSLAFHQQFLFNYGDELFKHASDAFIEIDGVYGEGTFARVWRARWARRADILEMPSTPEEQLRRLRSIPDTVLRMETSKRGESESDFQLRMLVMIAAHTVLNIRLDIAVEPILRDGFFRHNGDIVSWVVTTPFDNSILASTALRAPLTDTQINILLDFAQQLLSLMQEVDITHGDFHWGNIFIADTLARTMRRREWENGRDVVPGLIDFGETYMGEARADVDIATLLLSTRRRDVHPDNRTRIVPVLENMLMRAANGTRAQVQNVRYLFQIISNRPIMNELDIFNFLTTAPDPAHHSPWRRK